MASSTCIYFISTSTHRGHTSSYSLAYKVYLFRISNHLFCWSCCIVVQYFSFRSCLRYWKAFEDERIRVAVINWLYGCRTLGTLIFLSPTLLQILLWMSYLKWKRLFSISCGILTSRLLSFLFRWANSSTYLTFSTNKVDIILFHYQMFFRMLLLTYGRGHLWLLFLQLLVTIQNKDWQCMVSQRLLSLVSRRYMFMFFWSFSLCLL